MFAEAAKFSEDAAIMTTINRIMDMTYRLNMGSLQLVGNRIKTTFDPAAWVSL